MRCRFARLGAPKTLLRMGRVERVGNNGFSGNFFQKPSFDIAPQKGKFVPRLCKNPAFDIMVPM
jgi:hypothetical protein